MTRTAMKSPRASRYFKEPFRMKWNVVIMIPIASVFLSGCDARTPGSAKEVKLDMSSFYLPNAEGSRVVSVATNAGPAAFNVVVQTQAIATKEGGPKDTVARFGEVYAFSPTFIAVHRDEPVLIRFWNLQGDDNHDFMLMDPRMNVLMKVLLPPLKETPFVFTFHEEGLFNFLCAMHQPSMGGQILVLPPQAH
jgi:plastocyanin